MRRLPVIRQTVMAGLVPAIHVFPRWLIVALVVLCSGCTTYQPVDVAWMSVEAVDRFDVFEATSKSAALEPVPDTVRLGEMTMSAQEWREWRMRHRNDSHRLELKITFSTDENLPELSQTGVLLGPSVNAYFCEDKRGNEYDFRGGGGVTWRGAGLDSSDVSIRAIEAAAKPRVYSFYVWAAVERPMLVHGVPLKPYDLRTEARDICFYSRVPYGFAPGIHSNTVRVPAAAIAAALRELPPYFRQ